MSFVAPMLSRRAFLLILVGIAIQYVITYVIWLSFCSFAGDTQLDFTIPRLLPGRFVCIFREFDPEVNSLPSLVSSFGELSDVERILIVSDKTIYPPLIIDHPKAVLHQLEPSFSPANSRKHINDYLTTEWVLIVPDMVSFSRSSVDLRKFLRDIDSSSSFGSVRVFVLKVKGKRVSCFDVHYSHKEWTLYANSTTGPVCDGIAGTALFLVRTVDFVALTEPFARPIDESLLIQAAVRGWKTKILRGTTPFSRSEALLEPRILTSLRDSEELWTRNLYERAGVKRIVKNGKEEMYGCSKTTPRCFGSIINDTPSYLHEGRFLPPCCARALKNTLAHIVDVFNLNSVRYWLEGGSLLGAARNGKLIPWDYDIDLGIYLNDTSRVQYLEAAKQGPVVDPEGFVWEQSQPEEGQFFRVHYSRANRMHVDIFPFHSNNSIMTKNFWFPDHPQDREFPENFLTPIESVQFLGLTVPAPNRIRDFLELKFGIGCIENPKPPRGISLH